MEAISSLPGVGRRSSLRLALHLLGQPQANVHHFTQAINDLRDNVRYCSICHMIADGDRCPVCADSRREQDTVCVVESVRDVMSIEDTGTYRGVYHVLGGIISPIGGVGPADLSIASLVERVRSGGVREVIFALSSDVEGETTAFYIYRQIASSGVLVTSLARGIGFGADLEYADGTTLSRSIAARQPFSPEI